MRKNAISVLLLTGVLCMPALRGDTPDQGFPAEDAIHKYWAQFTISHVTDIPVQQYLAFWEPYLLWEGVLAGDSYSVSWDSDSASVVVEKNRNVIDDLIMGEDAAFRPTFEADLQDGVPQFTGFIDVDEVNEVIVIQVVRSGTPALRSVVAQAAVNKKTRRVRSGAPALRAVALSEGLDSSAVSVTSSECGCFGGSTASGSVGSSVPIPPSVCSYNACNIRASCGGTSICTWSFPTE